MQIQKKTNVEVWTKMQKNRELLPTIKEKKLKYIEHIKRDEKYEILQPTIEGRIHGQRSEEERRTPGLKIYDGDLAECRPKFSEFSSPGSALLIESATFRGRQRTKKKFV